MLRSMTGFGSAGGQVNGIEYVVELRSVNNRYFKASMKLPEFWSKADVEIEQVLRRQVTRGSVTASVRMRIPEDKKAYRVNVKALEGYVEQLQGLAKGYGSPLRIDLAGIMQLPGVCEPPPLEEMLEATHDALMKLVEQAVDALLAMRQREGGVLRADLLANVSVVEEQLAIVAKRAPHVVRDYHARLAARVAELMNAGSLPLDTEQLTREVAVFAERCDVAEEISRLGAHTAQFREAIDSPEPAGRKLDFIAQEMLREANTIGSKSNDADIARAVVEIKTAIDRIKEQAANAE
ncbi:MAG: YicC family protein [Phycisphaerae bacterium]|nr:YicC family protein [Phycisphaerae bacterium]